MRRLACLLVFASLPAWGQTVKILGKRVQGPVCGDGIINGSDVCDGSDFGVGVDCTDYGCTDGSLTCSVTCDEITTGACTGCPVTPNLLVETFDGANDPQAGYDNPTGAVSASWIETGTVDPNATTGCGTGTGWSGQCLKLDIPNFTETRTYLDLPAPHATTCSRAYVKWQSVTAWGSTSHDQIMTMGSTTATAENCDPYCVEGIFDGGTQLKLRLSLNPSALGGVTAGGASDVYPASGAITLPWTGRVEVCFTNSGVGDSWEWRVTDCSGGTCGPTVTEGTGGGDISVVDAQRILLGCEIQNTAVFYVDGLALSDEGFMGDE